MLTVISGSSEELRKEDGESFLMKGECSYYHYICDGFNDTGWGCGYRTLQTICSWIQKDSKEGVPSVREIQQILVQLEDKPKTFLNSREWIGSFEVCLVIDHLFDVPSKIIHLESGKELNTTVNILKEHFEHFGSPLMMGGNMDASSKGILGINVTSQEDVYLLVVDPHYVGKELQLGALVEQHWIKWYHIKDFLHCSFYNLCLPQMKYKSLNTSWLFI